MIPFNKPVHLGTELDAMSRAINVNGVVAGAGPFGKLCEERLTAMLGKPVLLVTSATHALEMAGLLLDLKPGDEVIVPSFTFVSTANAFLLRGAVPVFVDVGADGNLSLEEVEALITPKTRAIVPVHYGGGSCDMRRLVDLAGKIPVVEDAAQALTATFDGQPLGSFGACSAISFHETKNIGCGEGGALVLGTPALLERAHVLRDKGTNRRKFLDGLVDKYTWVDAGSSWVLSDLNAAYLSTQLEELARIQARRAQIHDRYSAELSALFERKGAYVVRQSPRCTPNHHLYSAVFERPEHRSKFIAFMRDHGVMTPFHYVALHQSPMGQKFGARRPLPWSERLSGCLVRLPLFYNLTESEQGQVIAAAGEFLRAL